MREPGAEELVEVAAAALDRLVLQRPAETLRPEPDRPLHVLDAEADVVVHPHLHGRLRPAGSASPCRGRRRSTSSRGRAPCRSARARGGAVVSSRAPVEPSGWPSAIAPPFTLTRSVSAPSSLLPGADDRRERLVHLEEVDVVDRHPVALEDLPRRGDRARQHQHGVDADRRLVDDPRACASAELVRLLARREQHRGGAVGDLRRVARGDNRRPP